MLYFNFCYINLCLRSNSSSLKLLHKILNILKFIQPNSKNKKQTHEIANMPGNLFYSLNPFQTPSTYLTPGATLDLLPTAIWTSIARKDVTLSIGS